MGVHNCKKNSVYLICGCKWSFTFDAHKFHKLCPEYGKEELFIIECWQGCQGLNKLNDIIPLTVKNQLTQKQQVI